MYTVEIQVMSAIKLHIGRYGQSADWIRFIAMVVKRLLVLVLVITANAVAIAQTPTDPGQLAERGQWVQTSEVPLSPRRSASVARSGNEIYVFGGENSASPCALPYSTALCIPSTIPLLTDGAAYDLTTDSWRRIANAPVGFTTLKPTTLDRNIYMLAWTGDTVENPWRLLVYQTILDSWSEIELPDSQIMLAISTFGNDLLLYSASDERGAGTDWLFATSTETWKRMPVDPLGLGFSRQYVAHENALYLFDKELVPSPGGADGPSYWRVARFWNEQWEVLPTADSIGFLAPVLVSDHLLISPELGCADGGSTNGYGRCIPFGAVFNTLSDTWSELPNAPDRGVKHVTSSGGLGSEGLVLMYKPGNPALDATTNQWFIFPTLDSDPQGWRSYHAVGQFGFVYGGIESNKETQSVELLSDAWVWVP